MFKSDPVVQISEYVAGLWILDRRVAVIKFSLDAAKVPAGRNLLALRLRG